MSKTTIPTGGIADDAVDNTKLDLTANYAFTGTVSGAGGGKINQIVQDSHESEVNVTSESFTGINLSVNITPSATSSKILVMASLEGVGGHSSVTYGILQLTKGGSTLKQFSNSSADDNNTSNNFYASSETCVYIDSPNSTSQLTYAVEAKRANSAGAWRMNGNGSSFSSITVWEILA